MVCAGRNKSEQDYKYAVDLFLKTLGSVTGKTHRKYMSNKNDREAWRKWREHYGDKSHDRSFIRDFVQFGINTFFTTNTGVDYTYSIRFSWVVGGEAIERWEHNDRHTNVYLVQTGIKKKFGVKDGEGTADSVLPTVVNTVRLGEENFKKKFHNTSRGLMWCVANTTLYFHESVYCQSCSFSEQCRTLLRENYPKIYRKRGYANPSFKL